MSNLKFHIQSTLCRLISLTGALTLAASPSIAATNLIVNGNFTPSTPGCEAASLSIPSWTVVSGNVDLADATCGVIKAPKGSTYYLDLTGSFAVGASDVGVIEQSVATVVGQSYVLTFDFGGNAQWQTNPEYPNDSPLKAMAVYVNGSISGVYSVNTASGPSSDGQWKKETITFTATASTTTVTFQSLNGSTTNPSDFGPLLGNVSLVAN